MIEQMIQAKDQYEILIVDDSRDSLSLLNQILKEGGYRVRLASSGIPALESVAAKLPDLILLDVNMPDMDGYEVCRRLKDDTRSRSIPVIFISSYGEAAKKVEGFKAGGIDFITKPFECEEVLVRVQTHLRLNELTERLKQQVDQRSQQLQQEISEREKAQEIQRRFIKRFEIIGKIDEIIRGGNDFQQVMGQVLEAVLHVFDCDRAWLLYPCDPEASSWSVPIERNHPDYPGAFHETEIPMTEDVAEGMREFLKSNAPVSGIFEPGDPAYDPGDRFCIRSYLITVVHPKVGKPWEFGLHQCSHRRVWTDEEISLFKEIANRVQDALSTMLLLSDLHKSESRFREVIQKAPLSMVILNQNEEVVLANDKMSAFSGYTTDDIPTAEHWWQLAYPEEDYRNKARQSWTHALQEAMAAKRDIEAQIWEITIKDGTKRTCEFYTVLLDDTRVIIMVDITDRIQAEEEVARQKRLFETMFHTITDGVLITNTKRQVRLANKGMEVTFGYLPEELIGHTTAMLYADGEKCRRAGRDMFDKKAKKPGELYVTHYRHKNGRAFPGETFGAKLFDENNQWIGNLWIMRDITERVNSEKRIQQMQKMESIGSLAGGIAHDFNNILYPIIGMSELLLEDLPPDSVDRENAEEIFQAGKRGSDLVKQILAFSRQTEHKMLPTRVQKILKEVLKLCRSTIPANIDITTDIQENCGMVMADPTQIHQVAMNIITNAYHAVETQGGEISVTFKEVMLEGADVAGTNLDSGKYGKLSITDTGCGIPAEIQNKIFDPYFTTKEKGKGTGLGLAGVYGIIKEHKGDIQVRSEDGKGTTFNIFLPLKDKPAGDQSIAPIEEAPFGTERILVIDDESSVAKLEKKMLERVGFKVTLRVNSIEALEAFKANPYAFDLILSDMAMPGMTGDQLAGEILSIRPDMPVIVCTGFSDRMDEASAAAMGIKGLVMKPVVRSELYKIVRRVLDEAQS